MKPCRAQRGENFFNFSSIRAKNNFELTFHNSFIAHHAPGVFNNFFHNGKPAGRINYYYERARFLKYIILNSELSKHIYTYLRTQSVHSFLCTSTVARNCAREGSHNAPSRVAAAAGTLRWSRPPSGPRRPRCSSRPRRPRRRTRPRR